MVELVNGGEGGDSPQRAVNRACRLIAQSGSGINTCLIVGAEAFEFMAAPGKFKGDAGIRNVGMGRVARGSAWGHCGVGWCAAQGRQQLFSGS